MLEEERIEDFEIMGLGDGGIFGWITFKNHCKSLNFRKNLSANIDIGATV